MSNIRVTSSQNRRRRKEGFIGKLVISLSSGLFGVFMTLGYQHFLSKPQSFTFIYNGEEMVVTEVDYIELENQYRILQSEINNNNNVTEEKYSLLLEKYNDLQYRYNMLMHQNELLLEKISSLNEEYNKLVDETTQGIVDIIN